jgi:hypothetical protein
MITGYNTDVEHDGVVYHVQTEDKGLETPLLLSLVYSGGAILASKRSTYHDLIAAGFDEALLAERLQRQHRLICAAITAGRIEDLKRMSAPPLRPAPSLAPPVLAAPPVEQPPSRPVPVHVEEFQEKPIQPPAVEIQVPVSPPPQLSPRRPPSPYTVYDSRRRTPGGDLLEIEEGLRITITGEKDFRGGDAVELELIVTLVSAQGEAPVAAAVSVKILGTSFRPMILSLKTSRDGSIAVRSRIPHFSTGRAAIVIRATASGLTTETRRVIHPG